MFGGLAGKEVEERAETKEEEEDESEERLRVEDRREEDSTEETEEEKAGCYSGGEVHRVRVIKRRHRGYREREGMTALKTSVTGAPSTAAIFNARRTEGAESPCSMLQIV